MLKATLKQFNRQQSGPPVFSLPSGLEVDVREDQGKIRLMKWILSQFKGSMKAADKAIAPIAERALRKAEMPWPYLIRSVENHITNAPKPKKYLPPDTLKKLIVSRFGLCRFEILRDCLAASEKLITFAGTEYNVSDHGELSEVVQLLLGEDYYPLFVALSPEFKFSYKGLYAADRLVDRLNQLRSITDTTPDLKQAQATLQDFFTCAIKDQKLVNEFKECLIVAKKFTARFFHPTSLAVKIPRVSRMATILDGKTRDSLLKTFRRSANQDGWRSDWFRQTLGLGIVTSPISWLLFVARNGFDPVDDYMDTLWYNNSVMCDAFGLVSVTSLFPELVV